MASEDKKIPAEQPEQELSEQDLEQTSGGYRGGGGRVVVRPTTWPL